VCDLIRIRPVAIKAAESADDGADRLAAEARRPVDERHAPAQSRRFQSSRYARDARAEDHQLSLHALHDMRLSRDNAGSEIGHHRSNHFSCRLSYRDFHLVRVVGVGAAGC